MPSDPRAAGSKAELEDLVPVYSFGPFELDVDRCELRLAGAEVDLVGKPFDTLHYLLSQHGQIVTQVELLREIWKVEAMSPSTVPTCIAVIRRALASAEDGGSLLETIRGRGYRLTCDVTKRSDTTRQTTLHYQEQTSSFFGRELELAVIKEKLGYCIRGEARIVFVTGEAGIGKTTFLSQIGPIARACGAQMITARCREHEGAPPLWPWRQIFRELNGTRSLAEDPDGGFLAESLLGLHAGSESKTPANEMIYVSPEQARFRLFDSLTQIIQKLASATPIVLLFDDLHRSDLDSLLLLEFALDNLLKSPVLFVASLREGEINRDQRARSLISSLGRHAGATALPLPRLSLSEVKDLLSAINLENDGESNLAAMLHQRSNGNPFFLQQLIQLIELNRLTPFTQQIDIQMPANLREAILRQVATLSEETQNALRTSAVAGREFFAQEMAAACDVATAEYLSALESAIACRIIAPIESRRGEFRFEHLLLRDALYESIPVKERARIHRRIAESIDGATSTGNPERAAELTHHYLESFDQECAPRALHFARIAAHEATRQHAYDDAVLHLRLAHRALESIPRTSPQERAESLAELGQAELKTSERETGRETLRQAANLAQTAGNPIIVARSALGLAPGPFAFEVGVFDRHLVEMLESACDVLPEGHDDIRTRLLARLSLALVWADSERRRHQLSDEAIRLAREVGDKESLAYALFARHGFLGGPSGRTERLSIADELGSLASEVHDAGWHFMARIILITDLLEAGQIRRALKEIHLFSSAAARSRQPHFLWYASLFKAMRELMVGHIQEAAEAAEQFHEIGERAHDANAAHSLGAHQVIRIWEQGDSETAARLTERLVEKYPLVTGWQTTLAHFYCQAGRHEEADRVLSSVGDAAIEELPRNEIWGATVATGAFACGELPDENRARLFLRQLTPDSSGFAVLGFSVAFLGPFSFYKGLLLRTLREWDEADHHFEAATDSNREAGSTAWLANCLYEHARMLARRGRAADNGRMQEKAREAVDIAQRLGMVRIYERASSLL